MVSGRSSGVNISAMLVFAPAEAVAKRLDDGGGVEGGFALVGALPIGRDVEDEVGRVCARPAIRRKQDGGGDRRADTGGMGVHRHRQRADEMVEAHARGDIAAVAGENEADLLMPLATALASACWQLRMPPALTGPL